LENAYKVGAIIYVSRELAHGGEAWELLYSRESYPIDLAERQGGVMHIRLQAWQLTISKKVWL
jgi:hypothetical protein